MSNVLESLGEQLQRARRARALSQADLAMRVGRDRARISEFERDLFINRMGRDRLTLLADICDALDLVPVLVPRARAQEVRNLVQGVAEAGERPNATTTAFDDLFVDLDDEDRTR